MTLNKQKGFILFSVVLLWGLISCSPEKSQISTGYFVRMPIIQHEDGTKTSFTSIDVDTISNKNTTLHTHDILTLEPVNGNSDALSETQVSTTCVANKGGANERILTDRNVIPFAEKNYIWQLFSKSFLFNDNISTIHSADCSFLISVVAKGGSIQTLNSLAKTQVLFTASKKPSAVLLDDGREPLRDVNDSLRIDYNRLSLNRFGFVDPRVNRAELLCDDKIANIKPEEFGKPMDRLTILDRTDVKSPSIQKTEQHCRIFGYNDDAPQPLAMTDLILMNMAKPPIVVMQIPVMALPSTYSPGVAGAVYFQPNDRYGHTLQSANIRNDSDATLTLALLDGYALSYHVIVKGRLDDNLPTGWSEHTTQTSVSVIGAPANHSDSDHRIYVTLAPGAVAQVNVQMAPAHWDCWVHRIIEMKYSLSVSEVPIYVLRTSKMSVEPANIASTVGLMKKQIHTGRLGQLVPFNASPDFSMTKENYVFNLCEIR